MTLEQLYNFFYNESEQTERFRMFNFLCASSKEQYPDAAFSDKFIEWIGRKSDIAKKIGVLDNYYDFKKNLKKAKTKNDKVKLNRNYQKTLKPLIQSKQSDLIDEWINLVESNHCAYIEYLNKLFENSHIIKYVIISEAPMLTIKEDKKNVLFDCKYIFSSEHEKVGSYRNVPFVAVQEINKSYNSNNENPSALELIDVFVKNRVLFLDLIPLPLPKIDRNLRKNWSTNSDFFINNEPRVITFLRCTLAFIFKFVTEKTEKEICFSDAKIALMMPSNSALGIINFYINLKENMLLKYGLCRTVSKIDEPFNGKIKNISEIITRTNKEIDARKLKEYSLRLHRQVAIGSQGGPELELLKHALMN
jgi:hypothetical protein